MHPYPPAKVVLVSLQRPLLGFHTADNIYIADIQIVQIEECQIWEKIMNFEPGPYGSVWADNCTESLPPALGGLWDASRTPKPTKHQQK